MEVEHYLIFNIVIHCDDYDSGLAGKVCCSAQVSLAQAWPCDTSGPMFVLDRNWNNVPVYYSANHILESLYCGSLFLRRRSAPDIVRSNDSDLGIMLFVLGSAYSQC